MRFLKILKNGAVVAASSYRFILVIWVTLLGVALLAGYPLRSSMISVFGSSMAVERLKDGLDLGLGADVNAQAIMLLAGFRSATFIVGTVGFLVMTFFAGGLFRYFTMARGEFSLSDFMKASASNFIPFLKVTLIMMAAIALYTFVIIGVPILITVAIQGSQLEPRKSVYLLYIVWALGLPALLFVADSSRRWIAATGTKKAFTALGNGFRSLRGRFWHAYGVMAALLTINAAFVVLLLWYTSVAMPFTRPMVFLFFVISQALFILRLFIKAWRYAAVFEIIRE